jgi:pyruvate dehydrogenase E2 component (dihydrolipoamide acetyltransferase)
MKIFKLPDLGEGLPDAEIVEWLVAEGDEVKLDEPLVSMETAKAVVEVPSPFTGKVAKLFGQAGDVIETGKPLAGFEIEGDEPDEEAPLAEPETEPEAPVEAGARADSGTVVGEMETSDTVVAESITTVAGVRVTPAVRALARKLKVDLASVTPCARRPQRHRAYRRAARGSRSAGPAARWLVSCPMRTARWCRPPSWTMPTSTVGPTARTLPCACCAASGPAPARSPA